MNRNTFNTTDQAVERLAGRPGNLFQAVFDALAPFVIVLDPDGILVEANKASLALTGLKRVDVIGKPFWEAPWWRGNRAAQDALVQSIRQAAAGTLTRFKASLAGRDGEEHILDFSIYPVRDPGSGVTLLVSEGRDLEDQDKSENPPQESLLHTRQVRYQTIFEEAGIGIALQDLSGQIIDCNPAYRDLLGYSDAELLGKPYHRFTHPQDLSMNVVLYDSIAAGETDSFRIEKRYIRKDGQVVWGRLTTSPIAGPDGKPQAVIAIVEDITVAKRMQAELIEVQRRLMQSREQDRLRLAQDIHDGPLQELVAIGFQLKGLQESTDNPGLLDQIGGVKAALQRQVRNLRSLFGELRPPVLEPFGLEKAIRTHAETVQKAHPELSFHFDLDPDRKLLTEGLRITLYRIYQELLNNALRHAQASHISIRFHLDETSVLLEVEDDGIGFHVPEHWVQLARQDRLGLLGIQERTEMVGGAWEIHSQPGRGTCVTVTVPRQVNGMDSPVESLLPTSLQNRKETSPVDT